MASGGWKYKTFRLYAYSGDGELRNDFILKFRYKAAYKQRLHDIAKLVSLHHSTPFVEVKSGSKLQLAYVAGAEV